VRSRWWLGPIATSDYGDSPIYAAFKVTQAYIDGLRRAADVAQEHGFTEVRKPDGPDWGLDEDELRLESPEISINPGGSAGAYFLFIDRLRHADYNIESRAIDLIDLQKEFDAAEDGTVVFMGDDASDLEDLYYGDQEEEGEDGLPADIQERG